MSSAAARATRQRVLNATHRFGVQLEALAEGTDRANAQLREQSAEARAKLEQRLTEYVDSALETLRAELEAREPRTLLERLRWLVRGRG